MLAAKPCIYMVTSVQYVHCCVFSAFVGLLRTDARGRCGAEASARVSDVRLSRHGWDLSGPPAPNEGRAKTIPGLRRNTFSILIVICCVCLYDLDRHNASSRTIATYRTKACSRLVFKHFKRESPARQRII